MRVLAEKKSGGTFLIFNDNFRCASASQVLIAIAFYINYSILNYKKVYKRKGNNYYGEHTNSNRQKKKYVKK